jgi:hypothetical protein
LSHFPDFSSHHADRKKSVRLTVAHQNQLKLIHSETYHFSFKERPVIYYDGPFFMEGKVGGWW